MATQRAELLSFAGFCILLILAVTLAGCTSQNAETTTPTTAPSLQVTTSSAPTPVLSPQPLAPTTAVTPAKPETAVQTTQPMEKVSLIINSAQKQKTVYTSTSPAGSMFLVLDITVKNNAMEKGYDLTDDSITLNYAKPGTPTLKSITTRVRGGLENPILIPTTIQLKDTRTGQVVFAVADISNMYTISLIDDKGAVVSSAPVTL
jgi:cytoskeletal protein RodZ